MNTRVKWAIGCVVALAMLALPAVAAAVFPGANGKILFVSGRGVGGDAEADVYTINGPNDTTLDGPTDLIAGQHRHPNWSADARLMVYSVRSLGDEDLLVHDNKLGSTVLLGTGSAAGVLEDHPAFSPNGAFIAYESEVTDGSGQEDILIQESDGTGPIVNLTNGAGAGDDAFVEQTPAWSPDGQFIYYARKDTAASTDENIFREPANNSGSPSALVDVMSGTNEFQPEISPDGTKLCYTLGPFGSNDADVMVANIDGSGSPFEVSPTDTMTPVGDYDCGWSPDGKTIAFTTGTFGGGQLQFAPSDDSGPITPYGNNSGFFDGNVDWVRSQKKCNGKLVTQLGTKNNDTITGTPQKDVIVAGKGNDEVNGGGDKDTICGGGGNDNLGGGAANDKLFGEKGSDTLRGGVGEDTCDGGTGSDHATACEHLSSVP